MAHLTKPIFCPDSACWAHYNELNNIRMGICHMFPMYPVEPGCTDFLASIEDRKPFMMTAEFDWCWQAIPRDAVEQTEPWGIEKLIATGV